MTQRSNFTQYRPSTGEKWNTRWWRFGWIVDRALDAAWLVWLFRVFR